MVIGAFLCMLFLLFLYVLVKSSDIFVDQVYSLGRKMGIPLFIMGTVITGIGTSIPELVSSLIATLLRDTSLPIGNVIGGNIADISLVIATAAAISGGIFVRWDLLYADLPILLVSTILLYFCLYDGILSRGEALILSLAFVVYLIYNKEMERVEFIEECVEEVEFSAPALICSLFLIYISSYFVVTILEELSHLVHLGTDVLAATLLAFGTSVPDMVVSVEAARKHRFGIVMGNIIGASIFRILFILGLCGMIAPLKVSSDIMKFSLSYLMALTMAFIIISLDRKINKYEAGLMAIAYLMFIGKLLKAI